MTIETRTTCCYCGVGCGVIVGEENGVITSVRGDPLHPANGGSLCSKGSQLHLTNTPLIRAQKRLLTPSFRTTREQPLKTAAWDETTHFVAERLVQTLEQHGPGSIGFYLSGQLLTEDYYVFNKLARGLIGTNHIDSNSRLCMSSAVAAYKQSLGSDAPPCSYDDLDSAALIMIIGANPAYAHPVLFRRLEEARRKNPAMKLIVVDPRRTDSASEADLHLQITPGTDVALLNGLLHICIWEDLIQREWIAAHTSGFAALRDLVRTYTPESVAKTCGIPLASLMTAARWFAASPASLSLYCQGLNQSTAGSHKNSALINLHLATGQIGKAGAGPFSLTGQPNAMGGREVGAMANLLSCHRDIRSEADRAEVAAFWGVDTLPSVPGKTAVEMFDAVIAGEIKVLWIACTNPAQSMPDQNRIRAALAKAELVIVQEAFADTATCAYADVLLPAASWAEKEGTVTNSERRISRVRAAIAPPGEARPDWQIAAAIAERMQKMMGLQTALFAYQQPEHIWNEHRDLSAGRDLDISGLSYALLEQQGPQQWPFPEGATTGKARLYTDGRFATADGRARFIETAYEAPADKLNARHPYILTTSRLRDHWHGMSRTGNLAKAFAHYPEPRLEMHPEDMQLRSLQNGDLLFVSNPRGSQHWFVSANTELKPGVICLPMHWGAEYVGGRQKNGNPSYGVNTLCSPACDAVSRQPELKYASVHIEKAALPWRCMALAWLPEHRIADVQQACRALFASVPYAHCVPFGEQQQGLLFEAAAEQAQPELLEQLQQIFSFDSEAPIRYHDGHRASRIITLMQGKLQSVLLSGDIRGGLWLKDWLQQEREVGPLTSVLFRNASPTGQAIVTDKRICQCTGVRKSQIDAFLKQQTAAPDELLKAMRQSLQCGTQCGSCVPELKKIIQAGEYPATSSCAA